MLHHISFYPILSKFHANTLIKRNLWVKTGEITKVLFTLTLSKYR